MHSRATARSAATTASGTGVRGSPFSHPAGFGAHPGIAHARDPPFGRPARERRGFPRFTRSLILSDSAAAFTIASRNAARPSAVVNRYSPANAHTRAPPSAAVIRRSPSMTLRENRYRSYTITPSDAPASNRAINRFQSGRTTAGFHAESELSRNTSPTTAPRATISSVHSSI